MNLNTILMVITLGVTGWVGKTTVDNAQTLARLDAVQADRANSVARMEVRLESMQVQLHSMEVDLAKLHRTP